MVGSFRTSAEIAMVEIGVLNSCVMLLMKSRCTSESLRCRSITKRVVEKPSVDGTVTSVEVFDAVGDMIVQFFGKRKPGNPELKEWRALAAEL